MLFTKPETVIMKVIMVGTCRFWMEAGCQSNQPCEKKGWIFLLRFCFMGRVGTEMIISLTLFTVRKLWSQYGY